MKEKILLENDIFLIGNTYRFNLCYNDKILFSNCNGIAYIPQTLIAIKKQNTIYICKPKIITLENTDMLYKLASFETIKANSYAKINIDNNTYIVDSNVEVTISTNLI